MNFATNFATNSRTLQPIQSGVRRFNTSYLFTSVSSRIGFTNQYGRVVTMDVDIQGKLRRKDKLESVSNFASERIHKSITTRIAHKRAN